MILDSLIHGVTMKGPCGGCGRDVLAWKRVCPDCRREYPTARPLFYWAYWVIVALMIPSFTFLILVHYLGVQI